MDDQLTSVVVTTDSESVPQPTDTLTSHSSQGRLHSGKLICKTHGGCSCVECRLDVNKELRCQLVELLDGHVHGPNCGHELVAHGDHYDYLVGSRLHHVTQNSGPCCEAECLGFLGPECVVDHGNIYVLPIDEVHRVDANPQEQNNETGCKKHFKDSHDVNSGYDENDVTTPLLTKTERHDDTNLVTTTIHAAGICCPSEEPIIKGLLQNLPGVESVDVIVLTKNVKVVHNPSQMPSTVILSALNEAGLQASVGRKGVKSSTRISVPWHAILSGICMGVAMLSVIFRGMDYLAFVALGAVVCGCPYILLRAFASLKQLRLDINILMLISVAGAISISEYLEAGAIVFLFSLSEWLEDACMGKARDSINFLLEMQPDVAFSATEKQTVPIEAVNVDDLLLVRPGDRVPVDGEVVEGETAVDESMLTGESKPVSKAAADKVVSGTLNSGYGSLTIRALKTAEQSTVAQLAAKVETASMQKSKAGLLVDKFARYYTPAVVFSALCLAIVPFILSFWGLVNTHKTERDWLYLSLVLLVCACPCALVLSTPVVSVCGISRAAKQAVLIKGGQYLETLAHIKAISFDKTGTLTEGRFGIVDIHSFQGTKMEVLRLVASLELHSTHPLGPAIVGSATAQGISTWYKATQIDTVAGKGIRGMLDGKVVSVGNLSMMAEDADTSKIPPIEVGTSGSLCYLAVDGEVVGAIVVADTARPDAVEALGKLKRMGLVLGMLTGDRWPTAKHIGKEVGIMRSHTHAELLPSDKFDLVSEYHETFKVVAHVGDGINDALALARADVGIAMGVAGAAIAVDAADVALFSNDLTAIPFAIGLARTAFWISVQNLVFAIVVKVTIIIVATFGCVTLWGAVLADVGSSLLVTLNGLRLLAYRRNLVPKIECKNAKRHSHGGCGEKSHRCASKQSNGHSHGESSSVHSSKKEGCCASDKDRSSKTTSCTKNTQETKKQCCGGHAHSKVQEKTQCKSQDHRIPVSGCCPPGASADRNHSQAGCKSACSGLSSKEDMRAR